VIAVDTNILIYAHRVDMPLHAAAAKRLTELATGLSLWAIPWPCVHEFLGVITNPRVFREPTPLPIAIDFLQQLRDSGRCTLLSEASTHFVTLSQLLRNASIKGAQVHDARIAAICIGHGASELWSADRDFSRYPALRVKNPLV
jgi:hypothetical protein